MVAGAAHRRSGVRPEFVRRMVGYRLPSGSVVVDVAWCPSSPLPSFTEDYPTLAVTPDSPRPIASFRPPAATPTVRADGLHLPLADASVDCVLLLDIVGGPDGGRGPLTEARRVLRPGGLAVLSAASGPRPAAAGDVRARRRRQLATRLTTTLTDLGLVPEQVHHIQSLLHPASLVARIRSGAGSGRIRKGRRANVGDPWLCRTVAAVNRLDPAQLSQWRPSAVVVLGRKP